MRAVRLIARREWRATVCSPTGLIVVALYLLVAGYLFWLNVSVTQEATLRHTFSWLAILTAFVVPLITMRLLSEELRSGTFEILTSNPISDVQIVAGKFLAGYMAFLTLSLPTLSYVLVLQIFGSPDWGPALCVYLGQQLLAAMLLALGLLISALTANQVLAAMGATIGGVLLWLAGTAAHGVGGRMGDLLGYMAMFDHFALFRRGIVDSRAVAYFVASGALFLYLAVRAVESRRWKFGVLPGTSATWVLPRGSILLCLVALVAIAQGVLSAMTHGLWTSTDYLLIVFGVLAGVTPVYLNRVRLRYELARRRMGIVLTVAANSLLVLTIWGLVSYFTWRHYVRFDTTSSKHYALSEETRKVLGHINTPVDIVVAMGGPTDLRQEIDDLLAEYAARCPALRVRYVDPLRSPGEIEEVRNQYKLTSPPASEILLAAGEHFRRIPVTSLVNRKFAVVRGRTMVGPGQFAGEAEITAAIIQLTSKAPGRIAFLSGHGEKSPDEQGRAGLTSVAAQLRQAGWRVDKHIVTPGSNAAFPADASVVVVAGPQKKLSDEDLRALHRVLDRGGGVLVLLDPGVEAGMDALLNAWNVRVANDIVVDFQDHVASADESDLYVTHFEQADALGKGMGSLAAVLPGARRIAVPAPANRNPNIFTSNFMHTSGDAWAVAYKPGSKLQVDKSRDRRGPISLGMGCERYQEFPEPGHKPLKGRLVVLGDSDFATNQYVDMAGNLTLFLNCVDWLAGRQELIAVRPKVSDVRRMELTPGQTQGIFWISMLVVPGVTVLIGVASMVKRRYQA